eukprot:13405472-Alexandrium_andersonii.AAC.1
MARVRLGAQRAINRATGRRLPLLVLRRRGTIRPGLLSCSPVARPSSSLALTTSYCRSVVL